VKSPLNIIFVACLVLSSTASSQDDERDKMRARDRSAFMLSITSQVTKEFCVPLIKKYESTFNEVYPRWLQLNKESVQRGRDETLLSLGRGADIDAYETNLIVAVRASLANLPKDRMKTRCSGTLASYGERPNE